MYQSAEYSLARHACDPRLTAALPVEYLKKPVAWPHFIGPGLRRNSRIRSSTDPSDTAAAMIKAIVMNEESLGGIRFIEARRHTYWGRRRPRLQTSPKREQRFEFRSTKKAKNWFALRAQLQAGTPAVPVSTLSRSG